MPSNPALFLAKIGQNLALNSRKWHKKNLIGENGGERKINPSANPELVLTFTSRINFVLSWVEHEKSFITSGPDIFLESTYFALPWPWKLGQGQFGLIKIFINDDKLKLLFSSFKKYTMHNKVSNFLCFPSLCARLCAMWNNFKCIAENKILGKWNHEFTDAIL